MEANLRSLGVAFAGYPPIVGSSNGGESISDIDMLVDAVIRDSGDLAVLLPTKVAVGRSFITAKAHCFGYLRQICEKHRRLAPYAGKVQKAWENAVFSLLAEDVYRAIVSHSRLYSRSLVRRAAQELLSLWEHRFDTSLTVYGASLIDLWRARTQVVPVFGTMFGTIELMKLSSLLDDAWQSFLFVAAENREMLQSVEEFIFGLTHEEIEVLRERMLEADISVVSRADLPGILGKESSQRYAHGDSNRDPRSLYSSFLSRAEACRHRAISSVPGPHRTLEEFLLLELLQARPTAGSART
ncbi:MAG: hypothetical protein EA428_14295 [Spirochaetaceae bacterium]|nr:MAG: hypothetical protein EA428_14295 [Spirochaetaceae bacterium]